MALASLGLWIVFTLAMILLPRLSLAAVAYPIETLAWVGFGLAHGSRRYGLVRTLGLLAIAVLISNISENLSITTGFPFGFYVHTAALGPKLFLVPMIIGPIYFGICYLAWTLAAMLLGEPRARGDWARRMAAPIVAAFIAVGFDLCFDPLGSTVARQWLYADSGAYYGVPLSNYLGWFFNAWLIFQCFAVFLERTWRPPPAPGMGYWYQAAAFWAAMGLQYPLMLVVAPGSVVVHDSGGWAWRSGDILQDATIMSIYTMLAAAVTSALVAGLRNRQSALAGGTRPEAD